MIVRPFSTIDGTTTVSVRFANGVVGQLFYSIFGFDSEDQETLEVVGEEGRILVVRHTGELDVVSDYGRKRELIDAPVALLSTSPERDDTILVRDPFAG